MIKLFVYGLLRKGKLLHKHMESATFLGLYTVKGFRVDSYSAGAFFLIKEPNQEAVGELYLVDEALKLQLDKIEAHFKLVEIEPTIFAYIA